MKRLNKGFIVLLAILCAIAIAITGCGNSQRTTGGASESTNSNQGEQEYAFVLGWSSLEFFNDPIAGMRDAADQLGVQLTVMGPSGGDSQAVSQAIAEAVVKGVKGIMVWGQYPGVTDQAINDAIDAGVPVITVGADIPDSNRLTCIMADQYLIGRALADITAEAVGGTGKVVTINQVASGAQQGVDRQAGFEDCLAEKYPNIELVERLDDEADPNKAATVSASAIQKHPDLASLTGFTAPTGVGAATAVREAGKIGEIKVIAVDRDEGTLDLLEAGEIYKSVVAKSYTEGYWGMQMVYAYANNKMAGMFISEEKKEIANIIELPDSVNSGIFTIDKDSVEAWRH